MTIDRETATKTADMPHAFRETRATQFCTVCGADQQDDRHTSWEQMAAASRERASHTDGLVRELGS